MWQSSSRKSFSKSLLTAAIPGTPACTKVPCYCRYLMNQWIQKVGVQCQSQVTTVHSDARLQRRLINGVNDASWEFWDAIDGRCGGLQAADHSGCWPLIPLTFQLLKHPDLWRTQPRFLGCFHASGHRATWLSIGKSCCSQAVYVTVEMVLNGSEFNVFILF